MISITYKREGMTSNKYLYKGKYYTRAEIGNEPFLNIRPFLSAFKVSADVYENAFNLGSLNMDNLADLWGGCLGQTYSIKDFIKIDEGVTSEQVKQKLGTLRLRNLVIEYGETYNYDIEKKYIIPYLKNQAAQIVSRGDGFNAQGDFDSAEDLYNEALLLDPDNFAIKEKLNSVKIKRDSKEKIAKLESQGDNLSSWDNYEEARSAYKKALDLDPENVSIKNKLAGVESRIAQRNADTDAAEERDEEPEGASYQKNDNQVAKEYESRQNSTELNYNNYVTRGDDLFIQGDYTGARAAYQSASYIKPNDAYVQAALIRVEQKIAEQKAHEDLMKKIEYDQKIQAQQSANMDAAVEYIEIMADFMITLGGIFYGDMGVVGDSYRYIDGDEFYSSWETGFSASVFPLIFNSDFTTLGYQGNYITTKEVAPLSPLQVNVDLKYSLGYESSNAGGEIFLRMIAGGGPWDMNGRLSVGSGGMLYFGLKQYKLYASYDIGLSQYSVDPWIDPEETGSGNSRFLYHQFSAGPRFTISKGSRRDLIHVGMIRQRLLLDDGISFFQYQNKSIETSGEIRVVTGLHFDWQHEHSFNAFINIFPNHPYTGKKSTRLIPDEFTNKNTGGLFVEVGFVNQRKRFGL